MHTGNPKLDLLIDRLMTREEGQDLVEYALVLALVGLGGFAGIESLAEGILHEFQGIISLVTSNTA